MMAQHLGFTAVPAAPAAAYNWLPVKPNGDFAAPRGSGIVSGPLKETDMRWETPQAIEMRFGMEITMYIARR
jgi:coenzyme PQQ precursor peptide PqqA